MEVNSTTTKFQPIRISAMLLLSVVSYTSRALDGWMHERYRTCSTLRPLNRSSEIRREGRRRKSLELSRYEVFMSQSTKSRMLAGIGIGREGEYTTATARAQPSLTLFLFAARKPVLDDTALLLINQREAAITVGITYHTQV